MAKSRFPLRWPLRIDHLFKRRDLAPIPCGAYLMELKQIIMLTVLLTVALVGSGALVYILNSLDKEDDENSNGDENGHHGGH